MFKMLKLNNYVVVKWCIIMGITGLIYYTAMMNIRKNLKYIKIDINEIFNHKANTVTSLPSFFEILILMISLAMLMYVFIYIFNNSIGQLITLYIWLSFVIFELLAWLNLIINGIITNTFLIITYFFILLTVIVFLKIAKIVLKYIKNVDNKINQ